MLPAHVCLETGNQDGWDNLSTSKGCDCKGLQEGNSIVQSDGLLLDDADYVGQPPELFVVIVFPEPGLVAPHALDFFAVAFEKQ